MSKIIGVTVGTPTSPERIKQAMGNGHYKPVILEDKINGIKYLVFVEDGELMSCPIKSGSGKTVILQDRTTGALYSLYVNTGDLYMESATDGTPNDHITITDKLTWLDYGLFIDNGEMQICEV